MSQTPFARSPLSLTEMEYLASSVRVLKELGRSEHPQPSMYVEHFWNWCRTIRPGLLLSTLSRPLSLLKSLPYPSVFRLPWQSLPRQTRTMRELEMVCGECSSYLALADDEPSTAILSLAYRFANAHVQCGYMTKGEVLEDIVDDSQEPLENQ